MSTIEKANQVLAEIDAALALAEKATAGPWISEDEWVGKGHSAIATTCHYAHDADAAFIAESRTLLPTSLRCLKTAIEEWVYLAETIPFRHMAIEPLTTLLNQWQKEASL